jgi:hypothetical protein
MPLNISTTNYTIAQLHTAIEDKHLTINREYQRSDEVWPPFARSLLVETVLLGYPMPKLIIRQRTDMKSLKTWAEIVDGQQRTRALLDFFQSKYKLANSIDTVELRGKDFNGLDEEDRQRFVTYSVGADVLVGASDAEVIEVFRRMNSYTAPLNGEEQRHATYQGTFKWFIYELRKVCEASFADSGVFKQKAIVRMQDAKLLTELAHALEAGISTTTKNKLDALYGKYDKEFPHQEEWRHLLVDAITKASSYETVPGSSLAKHYHFYSLALALIHAEHPQANFMDAAEGLDVANVAEEGVVSNNLAALAEALDSEDPDDPSGEYAEFVRASAATTNTKANRATRFTWFYKAITDQM